jgi:hypothetical protein
MLTCGVLAMQPTFGIYGELDATLDDADFGLFVDLEYNLKTKAFFPPETETSSGVSTPADSSTFSVLLYWCVLTDIRV